MLTNDGGHSGIIKMQKLKSKQKVMGSDYFLKFFFSCH